MTGYKKIVQAIPPFMRPVVIFASDGVTKKAVYHTTSGTLQQSGTAADGDRLQMFHDGIGNETVLDLGTYKTSGNGIFDIYINGILDSSGYDDYNATSTNTLRNITLTRPIVQGKNTIELRVNGKNALSSGYVVWVLGAGIR